MVEQTKFWGMPLRTRRQRQLLVVLYYLLFAVLAGLGLWWGPWSHLYADLIVFTGVLGGLLGGISSQAPVKRFEEPGLPLAMGDGTQTLNLSGRRNAWAEESLDERERTERDRAHYTAYRILRWTLGVSAVVYVCSLNWTYPGLGKELPVLVWILVVYVLSLPQAVVLWTEPEGPVGELDEVR